MLNYFSRMTQRQMEVRHLKYNYVKYRVHNSDSLEECFKPIFRCLRRSFHGMSS